MIYDTLLKETRELPDDVAQHVLSYVLFLKSELVKKPEKQDEELIVGRRYFLNHSGDALHVNLSRLADIKEKWNTEEEEIPNRVIDQVGLIVLNVFKQPMLFPTGRNSIQLEFELEDRSYLEFEVYEDKITCMVVPKREYDSAVFPNIEFGDINGINAIIKDFYNNEYSNRN